MTRRGRRSGDASPRHGALPLSLALLGLALAPRPASAQYGRDSVASRVVEIAQRDAPGATLVGQVETGRLSQGQGAVRSYALVTGSCYWFVAAGDGNVHDVDLDVRFRGVVLARDQSSTGEAVVPGERPYCPAEAQRVQVRVTAFRGGGVYAVGVYSGAPPPEEAEVDMHALLDRAASRYAAGMGQAGEPRVAPMTTGEDLEQEVRLGGGRCYRFVAVGGPGVEDLELHVYQGSSEVARDAAMASEAVASYCATADTPVRVRLRMHAGRGQVAVAPYSGGRQHGTTEAGPRRPSGPAVPVGGPEDDFLARQIRTHHGRVGEGRAPAGPVHRASLRTSQDRTFPVRLEAGRCYTIVAVGAPSVRDLDLYLLDPAGLEVEADTGPANHAVVQTDPCPRWDGTYTVRLRVFAGYGDVAVQAFGN